MSLVLDIASWVLMLIGCGFALTAAIGLLRLPDFFSRTHSAGMLDTLGAGLILLGMGLQAGWTLASFKLFAVLAFILITGPTAAHALARTARHLDMQPVTGDDDGEDR